MRYSLPKDHGGTGMAHNSLPAQRSRWLTNPLTRSLFGHNAPFSIVTYWGRRSTDVPAQAPVLAFPHHGGFIVPLLPRSRRDWVHMILTAEECHLQYRRRLYPLRRPIMVQAHPSELSMPGWLQKLLSATGTVDYLRLRVNFAGPVRPATPDIHPAQ
jgi:hypothetical protein